MSDPQHIGVANSLARNVFKTNRDESLPTINSVAMILCLFLSRLDEARSQDDSMGAGQYVGIHSTSITSSQRWFPKFLVVDALYSPKRSLATINGVIPIVNPCTSPAPSRRCRWCTCSPTGRSSRTAKPRIGLVFSLWTRPSSRCGVCLSAGTVTGQC